MDEQDKQARFEQCILPHLDAAYNLARWLAGNEPDAQDVVQDAFLRAYKFFGGFRGGDSRSWLLRIVRNAFYDSLARRRRAENETPFDEALHGGTPAFAAPDAALLEKADQQLVRQAMAALPVDYREVLVMRELERLSYKEIADVAELPLGTVMSRLARAREHLHQGLRARLQEKVT